MDEAGPSPSVYYRVFAALAVLLALTVGLAFVDLGRFNTAAALSVAWLKAVLVVLYFMHVRYGKRLIALTAAAGLVWLAIMLGLTLCDYMTRDWLGPR